MKLLINAENVQPGTYTVSIELQDYNKEAPLKSTHDIEVEILQAFNSTKEDSDEDDGTQPTLSIYKIDKFGKVEVRFSEYLLVPKNIT